VSSSFWILSAITAQSYLIMYVLMFAAALRLRKTHASVPRPYRTPALPLVAGVGAIASAAAILLGFVPPSQWTSGLPTYLAILVAGMLALSVGPFLFYHYKKPSWVTDK
jgi:amino acid transporter